MASASKRQASSERICLDGSTCSNASRKSSVASKLRDSPSAIQDQQQQTKQQQIDACHRLLGRLGLSLPMLNPSGAYSSAQLSWCRKLLEACDQFRRDRDQLTVRLHQRDRELADTRRQLVALQSQQQKPIPGAAADKQPATKLQPPQMKNHYGREVSWSSGFTPPQCDTQPRKQKVQQQQQQQPQPKSSPGSYKVPTSRWDSRQSSVGGKNAQNSLIPRPIQSPSGLSSVGRGLISNKSSPSTVSLATAVSEPSPIRYGSLVSVKLAKQQAKYRSDWMSKSGDSYSDFYKQKSPREIKQKQQQQQQQPQKQQQPPVKQHRRSRLARHRSRATVDLDAESVRRHWRSRTYDKVELELENGREKS